jgi:hypothetical protein
VLKTRKLNEIFGRIVSTEIAPERGPAPAELDEPRWPCAMRDRIRVPEVRAVARLEWWVGGLRRGGAGARPPGRAVGGPNA